jgi:AcrR family transcriptional regulator
VADGARPAAAVRAAAPRSRRTQAERRATTRTALLDAALACLIEDGYAGMTTRKVAERAGVSQGTQMHYFPTRAAFVAEAVRHVAFRLAAELREQDTLHPRTDQRRLELMLDQTWEIHTGPVFQATMELWVAARTDPELTPVVVDLEARLGRECHRIAVDLLAADEHRPGVRETVQATLDLARGLALANLLTDDSRRRKRIVRQWADMVDNALRIEDGA